MSCSARLRWLIATLLVCSAALIAQQDAQPNARAGKRASSRISLGANCSLDYLGAFVADGSFKGRSRMRLGEFVGTVAGQSDEEKSLPGGVPPDPDALAPSKQRVVEDYEPGAHAVETVNGRPVLADVVDAITSFAEEHKPVLDAPRALATDSKGRLIVADPLAHAVHVLDIKGKTSFRIQGGKDRRLQKPVDVAVDGWDNIYVSDADRGMVLVYDVLGRFRHYIGKVKGEAFFERPEGIAVDAAAGRVYVADTPRSTVVVFDLHGVLQGIFGDPAAAGKAEWTRPTSVVLHSGQLYVLDTFGSRVQILDLQGHLLRRLSTPQSDTSPSDRVGLALDGRDNIYVSDASKGTVRVYNQEGRLLNSFGRAGAKSGEFSRPLGVWVDGRD